MIIPDLPGWGESTRLAGQSYDIDAQAVRLNDFLLVLDLREINLVGYSTGGAIAGVYAAETMHTRWPLRFNENPGYAR